MKIILAFLVVFLAYMSLRFTATTIARLGASKSVNPYRVKYITKTINLSLFVFYSIAFFAVLGIGYTQVSIFLSSVFAVIGVAMFAQWSILSNITASLIIFFGFPYRVGDHIRVLDKDGDIRGVIDEIDLFHVLIRLDDVLVTYPNTLILQKAVIKYADEGSAKRARELENEKLLAVVNHHSS